ncbi:MAG: glycosyltransferase family 1 protein [Alphaproteobacteria bacterium]|nr:MAG: glycosyltransferase family 1 protein [Alphaproteobacteria bacterium]
MTILHLHFDRIDGLGGTERVIAQLHTSLGGALAEMAERGGQRRLSDGTVVHRVARCCWPRWSQPRAMAAALRSTWQLYQACQAVDATTLAIHLPVGAAVPASLLPRAPRLVAVLHGPETTLSPDQDPAVPIWQQRLYRRADAIVAVSHDLAAQASARHPSLVGRITVITNHPDPVLFDHPISARAPNVIAFVGRLALEKGVDVLLHAAALLPQVTVLLVGDGPERARLGQLSAALGLEERVRFLGALPPDHVAEAIAPASLLVIPSRQDAAPLVAVESLALGRPVVASNVGGLPDLIGPEDGMLVPAADPAALATAITASLSRPWPCEAMRVRAAARFGTGAWRAAWAAVLHGRAPCNLQAAGLSQSASR